MTHTQLTELVRALLDAPTSNETVKEFAQSWINAEVHLNKKNLQNNSYP